MKPKVIIPAFISCVIPLMAQESVRDEKDQHEKYLIESKKNVLERKKCDTKIRFEKNGNESPVRAELEISPDSQICHVMTQIHSPGRTKTLIDHAPRFSEYGQPNTRLSGLNVWFDGQQVVPPSFPTNQIYGFTLNGQYPHYGMFNTFNQRRIFSPKE